MEDAIFLFEINQAQAVDFSTQKKKNPQKYSQYFWGFVLFVTYESSNLLPIGIIAYAK